MSVKKSKVVGLSPLTIIWLALAAPLLVVLGFVFGEQMHGKITLTTDSITSWISAIATVAIAVLTFILAKETWYLREAQTKQLEELKRENIRPSISIKLEGSSAGLNFINVIVSNLGKGIARKVSIKFFDNLGNEIPKNTDVVVEKFRKLGIFNHGIQSMGIGQEISSFVFSFFDLDKELKDDIFKPILNMTVIFEDIEGYIYTNDFTIDFSQYEGMSELGGNALYEIAQNTKKISESFGKIARNSNGRVGVDVFYSEDRQKESDKTREWMDKQRKNLDITK